MTSIRTAVAWPNDKTYLFYDDNTYQRFDSVSGHLEQSGLPVSNWTGLTGSPDAFIWWGARKGFAFTGPTYVRYDAVNDSVDPGFTPPISTSSSWTGLPSGGAGTPDFTAGFDAAVNWGNGKVYLFKGAHYLRYDMTEDRVDPGYPKLIAAAWPGVFESNIGSSILTGQSA